MKERVISTDVPEELINSKKQRLCTFCLQVLPNVCNLSLINPVDPVANLQKIQSWKEHTAGQAFWVSQPTQGNL